MTTRYAEKVKEMRTKRARPQEQLATVAGVDMRTMQRIEHDERASFETLKTVANAFGVEVENLLAAPRDAKDRGKQATPAQQPCPSRREHPPFCVGIGAGSGAGSAFNVVLLLRRPRQPAMTSSAFSSVAETAPSVMSVRRT